MATDANNLKLSRITGATAAQFLTTIIASGSVYWHEVQKRIFVGDGTTQGGVAAAMQRELLSEGPTLTEAAKNKALTALGVYAALETLITEYGGTVPTSEQSTEDQA